MKKILIVSFTVIFLFTACTIPTALPATATTTATSVSVLTVPTETPRIESTSTIVPITETFTPVPTSTQTAVPAVEKLEATVTADLLSCRYGPGSEYLYLYGLRKGANIQLIGRTNGNQWVMVAGKSLCWVNAKFIDIKGDPQTLNVMYPGGYKLPVSPYYSAATVLSAVRDPNNSSMVTVKWTEIALTAGDEEDESMFIYIIEVWRCEGGKIIFDPLASNYPEVTFVDEAGCDIPSHGRLFFQEKHGFAGPSEIPWPAQ